MKSSVKAGESPMLLDFEIGDALAPNREPDGSQLRQAPSPSDATINAATVGWMKQLPPEISPVEIAIRYPRIVNRLARYWDIPRMIHEYFEDLLFVKRARRKGFPPGVKAEIIALCNYYRSIHPIESNDLWDAVPFHGKSDATADQKPGK